MSEEMKPGQKVRVFPTGRVVPSFPAYLDRPSPVESGDHRGRPGWLVNRTPRSDLGPGPYLAEWIHLEEE